MQIDYSTVAFNGAFIESGKQFMMLYIETSVRFVENANLFNEIS